MPFSLNPTTTGIVIISTINKQTNVPLIAEKKSKKFINLLSTVSHKLQPTIIEPHDFIPDDCL